MVLAHPLVQILDTTAQVPGQLLIVQLAGVLLRVVYGLLRLGRMGVQVHPVRRVHRAVMHPVRHPVLRLVRL